MVCPSLWLPSTVSLQTLETQRVCVNQDTFKRVFEALALMGRADEIPSASQRLLAVRAEGARVPLPPHTSVCAVRVLGRGGEVTGHAAAVHPLSLPCPPLHSL